MLSIEVLGYKKFSLCHLVLDFNGTLAADGNLIEGTREILNSLSQTLKIHILTGDIYGTAKKKLKDIHCHVHIISPQNQVQAKADYIQQLYPEEVAAIGNGRNDIGMIEKAHLGIFVVGEEGGSPETLRISDVFACNIINALNLFVKPQRLIATLRS